VGNPPKDAVYVSGTNDDKTKFQKLLGVPEIPDSTGSSQEFAVSNLLSAWQVETNVTGLVFDTTASNTGQWHGACTLLETYLGKAVLWLACHHHISELHIKHVVEVITGDSTEPGMKLFKHLAKSWPILQPSIDYNKLNKFDWDECSTWMKEQAEVVLLWAVEKLKCNTFPRDDYKELLQLVIVWLGGYVENFRFRTPGPDHHARWMSKAIYFLKLSLLEKQFSMDTKERNWVHLMSEYVGIFYAKYFFQSPLSAAAPLNDIRFLQQMLKYRHIRPLMAETTIESIKRHLWYLAAQLVIFSLADETLSVSKRESLAKVLYETPKPTHDQLKTGKPQFPSIEIDEDEDINLDNLINEQSWLIFDLLECYDILDYEWMTEDARS